MTVLGAGPELRNCLRPRARPAALTTWTVSCAARAAVPVDHRFVQVAVGAVDHGPAGDVQFREDVLHPAHHVGQLGRSDGAAAVGQGAAVPGVGAGRQQHRADDRHAVAGEHHVVDVAVVRRGLQPVDEPGGRDGGQDLPADELHGPHFPLDPGLGPEDPALAGQPVDLLAGQALRDQRHLARPGVLLEGRNVDRGVGGRVPGRVGAPDVGRGAAAGRRGIKVGPFVGGPARRRRRGRCRRTGRSRPGSWHRSASRRRA